MNNQKINEVKEQIQMEEYYYKVIGMDNYVLGYTSCKETWLKESIKEGWKESQLKFIKLK